MPVNEVVLGVEFGWHGGMQREKYMSIVTLRSAVVTPAAGVTINNTPKDTGDMLDILSRLVRSEPTSRPNCIGCGKHQLVTNNRRKVSVQY